MLNVKVSTFANNLLIPNNYDCYNYYNIFFKIYVALLLKLIIFIFKCSLPDSCINSNRQIVYNFKTNHIILINKLYLSHNIAIYAYNSS